MAQRPGLLLYALCSLGAGCATTSHYHPRYRPNHAFAAKGATLLARVILVGDAGDPPSADKGPQTEYFFNLQGISVDENGIRLPRQ